MKIIALNPARFSALPDYKFAENWLTIDLGEGLSAKMVAQRIGLSPETVRGHIREIFKRLEVSNKAQAVNVFMKAERSVKMKLND